MKKSSFEGFIARYSLGGEVESVKINSTDEGMSVKFISDDKTLLGSVESEDKDFPNGEFGVYTTSQLKGLLGVLDSNIDVTQGEASLVFGDKGTSVNYMLADLSVIPVVPDLKQVPTGPFIISMEMSRCTPPVIDRMNEILRSHPGGREVHLRLVDGEKNTVLKLDENLKVTSSPSLSADLKTVLGPDCLVV